LHPWCLPSATNGNAKWEACHPKDILQGRAGWLASLRSKLILHAYLDAFYFYSSLFVSAGFMTNGRKLLGAYDVYGTWDALLQRGSGSWRQC
jgi:hypothetical protein